MKQTAVQWLMHQMLEASMDRQTGEMYIKLPKDAFQQAKKMEREQSQKMYEYAAWAMFYNGHGETFEEYWNKNFKSE